MWKKQTLKEVRSWFYRYLLKCCNFCVHRTDSHHCLFTQALLHGALHLQKVVLPWLKMIGQRPGKVSPWQPPQVQWHRLMVVVPSVCLNTEIQYMYIMNVRQQQNVWIYVHPVKHMRLILHNLKNKLKEQIHKLKI